MKEDMLWVKAQNLQCFERRCFCLPCLVFTRCQIHYESLGSVIICQTLLFNFLQKRWLWYGGNTQRASLTHPNVFIAAFTTTYALLKLYSVMDNMSDRVLYDEIDSIIFVSRPGDWVPPLGDFLGELTSELDPSDHIVEFVSAGPKM